MKYWAYVKNEILGPFEKEKLLELPEFASSLLICPQTPVGEKTEDWKEASAYPEIATLLGGQGGAAASEPPAIPPAAVIGETSAAAPLEEPAPLSPAQSSTAPAPAPAAIEPASIELEPRADAAPKAETGGLKHLNPTPINPAAIEHKETGGAFDIPVVKLSGELSGHGKIGHPGTIQSEELHHDEKPATAEPAPAAAPREIQAVPEAAAPAEPAPAEAKNFSTSFDPISLSSIGGRNTPPEAAPSAQPADFAPQPAAAAPPFDPSVIEEIIKRNLKLAASPPPDIRPHLDPLVIKIDQMGEILSSMRNSRFQQEVMTKIGLIEDSISELRRMVGDKQGPAAEKPAEKGKTSGLFGFGAAPAKKETSPAEKAPAPEPAKEEEIVDEGSKGESSGSRAGAAVKKLLRGIMTLILLVAVLGGAAFMLRNLGIFDVTPYIPFAIPGLTPPAAEQTDAVNPDPEAAAGQERPAADTADGAPAGQPAPGESPVEDVSPEIVFLVRTYSAKEGGEILESKIFADAIGKNGELNKIEWKISPPDGDNYKAEAVIPVKDGKAPLVYAFTVERGNKRVTPSNLGGREVMQALFGQKPAAPKAAAKKPARKTTRPARKTPEKTAPKAAPKPAPKAAPATAPAETEPAEDDEYEYVYV